ncbi:TRAP transporter substrate-binding protein [Roseomonas sp. PWR1]|uniref:TRAP transporter substrate-binding protein n=1 Tax=Roseomonas nitratireducens TaxID=2820810 RepID=A0ABS4AUN8_9PROT|nr:TRAP transporter substrate-binding protein [Neoroseomonas nitratireducens]MBP0465077.1 TRAP transporter substrate-binding protein [Neoroseomonas nitratireducens]
MNIAITRRAALAGAAILAAPATLRAQGQVRLTLAHGTAAANPRGVTAERMAARLRELSNGRIEMRVAHAAQLGDDVAMLTALRTGTLDMSVNSQGPTSSLVPEIAALGLPFLFPDAPAAYRVVDGPVGQELATKLAAVGLHSLGFWDNGIRHITNRRRAINRPEDLRGLRIRTPADPATIDTFQALGAATQQINFSELYVALQQGVVDGQENPLANIHASKLHEVNRFISLTAHKWECSPFLASRAAWGRLAEADRALVTQAAREATEHNRMLMQQADVQLLAEYRGMSSVEVNVADQAAFRAATAGVLDAWQNRPIGAFVRQLRAAVS